MINLQINLRINTINKRLDMHFENYPDFIYNLSKGSLDSIHRNFLDNYILGCADLFFDGT